MPIISLIRDIKLTNEYALKILNHKPSEKLQAILKSIDSKDSTKLKENKLFSTYLKKSLNRLVEIFFFLIFLCFKLKW